MPKELEAIDNLLDSAAAARGGGKLREFTFAAMAVYLFGTAFWTFSREGVTAAALINFGLGFCAVAVIKFRKSVYISSRGVVKELCTWRSKRRDVLPWDDIRHVIFMIEGERMTAFFERKEPFGLKVPFTKADVPALEKIIKQYAPNVTTSIMDKNKRR